MEIGKLGDIKDFGIYDNPLLNIALVIDRTRLQYDPTYNVTFFAMLSLLRPNMNIAWMVKQIIQKYLWNLF